MSAKMDMSVMRKILTGRESPSAWRQRLDARHLSSAFADASVRRGWSKECGENKTKRKNATK